MKTKSMTPTVATVIEKTLSSSCSKCRSKAMHSSNEASTHIKQLGLVISATLPFRKLFHSENSDGLQQPWTDKLGWCEDIWEST